MSISGSLRLKIEEHFQYKCAYCRMPASLVYAIMPIDHIQPKALGGTDDEENLCLSCPLCNTFKHDKAEDYDPETNTMVSLFHPRLQKWHEHFQWNTDDPAIIRGITASGRATLTALRINDDDALAFRRLMVSDWRYPPKD
jgi:hypothetical protein